MELEFTGDLWFWRGPAPWHFITIPDDLCGALEAASPTVSYGWGMIPVTARVRGTEWATSLFPKDGLYILPVKTSVRRAEGIDVGDRVKARLIVDV